jgi:hypothetical protein
VSSEASRTGVVLLVWSFAELGFGSLRIRFMVGDLELNFGDAMFGDCDCVWTDVGRIERARRLMSEEDNLTK